MPILPVFPLQTIRSFQMPEASPVGVLASLVGVAVIVAVIALVVSAKNKGKVAVLSEGYVPVRQSRSFSMFALRRMANSIGLNRQQTKMLESVLKTSGVTNIDKAFSSPELMDRYFKLAYRHITEENRSSDEDLNKELSLLFTTRRIVENGTGASISSTRQIKENTAAILMFAGNNYPTKVNSVSGDTLIVELPPGLNIPKESKVSLGFFSQSSNGFSVATRAVGSVDDSRRPMLKLAHTSNVKMLSSRHFRRRKTAISVTLSVVMVEDPGRKNSRLFVGKKKFMGNIEDISAGGCAIKTTAQVGPGQKLKIEFSKGEKIKVAALGEILRTNKTGYNTVIHVKFLKIPRKSLNFINAMVYEYTDN